MFFLININQIKKSFIITFNRNIFLYIFINKQKNEIKINHRKYRIRKKRYSHEILKKFGEILFGDFRGANEKDTEYEQRVFELLKSFILKGYGDKIDKQFLKHAQELKELKKYYPILEPRKKGKYFYRGTSLPTYPKLDKAAEKGIEQTKLGHIEYVRLKESIKYIPHSPIQSWTVDSEIAKLFKGELNFEPRANEIPVIVEADLKDDNMLFDFNFLNQVALDTIGTREYEVIRVNKAPVNVNVLISYNLYLRKIEPYL